jgi:peroxiredoxin
MRFLSIILLLTALAVSSFAQQNLKAGSPAPLFTAAALDGRTVDLNSLQGNIVVVTFWSTKCSICHSEIPKLNQIAERYKGQNVVFLGLTMENPAKVEAYLRKSPFKFSILPNSFGVVLQYADKDRHGNIEMGFPAHFVVNQRGEIDLRTSGFAKSAELDSRISRLLASQSSHQAQSTAGQK